MRIRNANPYNEGHGKNLRVYEFIADGSKDASAVCAALETALGLRLRGDPTGQHGYVNTSPRPDGSLFVAVVLYEACDGAPCSVVEPFNAVVLTNAGGASVRGGSEIRHSPQVRATDLNPAKLAAAKTAVGEHPQHKLTGNAQADAAKLRALGFTGNDPVLRD